MSIKLIKSSFYHEEETKNHLCDFIQQAEQLSIGKYCRAFEEQFVQRQGRGYAVFFNSGSSANLALLQSLLNMKAIEQ
jgi:CDP-6-deoxy-D-xylo-4-hexulose-3-dehydrase